MAMLNLNNSSSTTEHHQTGYLSLPSEQKNSKCYRSSEEGDIFVFLDGQKKIQGVQWGEIPDLALEGMGMISIV